MAFDFISFPKIPRLSRECTITEKLDGTNAHIWILSPEEYERHKDQKYITKFPFVCGSRNRWITPENDNQGFAKWAFANVEDLLQLGTGHHFGEWWGGGIQRGYGLKLKHFSLFNTRLWEDDAIRPRCCDVVPILYQGVFDTRAAEQCIERLKIEGSVAVAGYPYPEGIVIYHAASNSMFKKTCEDDESPKGVISGLPGI